jgi:BirA family biotin operon repressor/biotin-[acetyl-CoA-carboxylase] ligase
VGTELHILESTVSTTDDAWEAVTAGKAPDGAMFLAESQSAGRGRMGRQWDSPPRLGLYLSFVARVKLPSDKLPYMTSFVALALANTVEQFSHLPAEIKWPNDVMIGGRKVAGILVESRSTVPDTFVVGLGLNVNQSERDIPETLRGVATSLRMERRGPPQHRVRLLRQLIFYLDSVYAQVKKKKFDRVAKTWAEFVNRSKRPVIVVAEGTEFEGLLTGMDLEKGVTVEVGGKLRSFKPEHVQSVKELPRK